MITPINTYYENGQLKSESWLLDGEYHRVGGPSDQIWYANGQLKESGCAYTVVGIGLPPLHLLAGMQMGLCTEQWWCINNMFHRKDGPAIQAWFENGQLRENRWYMYNNWYRFDGPAYESWHQNGKSCAETWFWGGIVKKENHPFIMALHAHDLYREWCENALTEDDWVLIRLCV